MFGKEEEPCHAGTMQNVNETRELRDKEKA